MLCTYEEYLQMPKSIAIETCFAIHRMMIEEIGDDEDAIELYNEIIEKSAEYAMIRAKWTVKDKAWKMAEDPGRTMKHDSLIVKFNQLAKYLKLQGKEAAWRDKLGYEEDDQYNRKVIGDMACFLTFIHGVNGR